MRKTDGKVNFTTLLMVVIIGYSAFAAIKLVANAMMQTQIEKEVVDAFGLYRGHDFTDRKGVKLIKEILAKKDILFDEQDAGSVEVTIEKEKGKIFYYFRYEVEVDLI
ncbi:MAG: hypothetical protein GY765_22830, partial [bacterium]|nr:hypothetical protein [bacterium]